MEIILWTCLNKSTTLLYQTYKNQKYNDSEYFKWFLEIHFNPAGHHPAIITKADKDFGQKINA